MIRHVATGLLLWLVWGGFSAMAEGAKAPAPDWVIDYPVDLSAREPADGLPDGRWRLLEDDQVNGAELTHYTREVEKYTTQAAISDGSRISVEFDPTYQTLTWHKLQVIRDGQVLDRLRSKPFARCRGRKTWKRTSMTGPSRPSWNWRICGWGM